VIAEGQPKYRERSGTGEISPIFRLERRKWLLRWISVRDHTSSAPSEALSQSRNKAVAGRPRAVFRFVGAVVLAPSNLRVRSKTYMASGLRSIEARVQPAGESPKPGGE
jgi:hypothetical protein